MAQIAIAIDIGLGGVPDVVVVDDLDLVFFCEPPRDLIGQQGVERIGHRQHAGELALAIDRDE